MRPRIAWTIFRKELLETLRDRRTLFMMIVLPVLLYPMMIIAFSWFMESQSEAREERASTVAVWGTAPDDLVSSLRQNGKLTLRPWAGAAPEVKQGLSGGTLQVPPVTPSRGQEQARSARAGTFEAENQVLASARPLITGGQVDAVIVFWPGFDRAVADGGLGQVSVYFDSVRLDSTKALERLNDALAEYRTRLVREREQGRGLAAGFSQGIDVLPRNVAGERRRAAEILGSVLPFILIVMSMLGGFYPAIDLTAGEKERGTMQTLMCAPVGPTEIIVGKFGAVWVMSLISALMNVGSLAATLARLVPGQQFSIPPSSFALTFVMLVPVSFTMSAVFLAVATFAKDFKDGQNFLTPVYSVLALPAAITMLPGIRLSAGMTFVPVLNIALLIKSLLVGEAPADLVFLTLLSSLVYATLAVLLASWVFQQEQVLLGGRQSMRELFGLERRAGGVPSSTMAIVSFAALLVLVFYGSQLLSGRGIVVTLVSVEYGFFLAPTLAVVLGLGFSARDTLALRLPPLRGVIAAVLIGISAWTVAGGLLIRLLPPPESLVRALTKILLLDGKPVPLWVVWLAIGLTPAICEEIYFRGFALSGLRRFGKWPAVLLSALFFGLAHSSIYRMLPTAFLGLLFAWMVWKTGSVVCSVIAHTLNNGLMATLVSSEGLVRQVGSGSSPYLPWKYTLAGAAVLCIALLLLRSLPEAGEAANGQPAVSGGQW
jgi:sodium transport system permease protein